MTSGPGEEPDTQLSSTSGTETSGISLDKAALTNTVSAPPSKLAVVVAALAGGIGAGILGTSLHGHTLRSGESQTPIGALAALLLLVSVEVFVGLWSKNAWVIMLTGGAAYFCAGLFSLQLGGGLALVANNTQGMIWLFGIAVVTPLASLLIAWLLRRAKQA